MSSATHLDAGFFVSMRIVSSIGLDFGRFEFFFCMYCLYGNPHAPTLVFSLDSV